MLVRIRCSIDNVSTKLETLSYELTNVVYISLKMRTIMSSSVEPNRIPPGRVFLMLILMSSCNLGNRSND